MEPAWLSSCVNLHACVSIVLALPWRHSISLVLIHASGLARVDNLPYVCARGGARSTPRVKNAQLTAVEKFPPGHLPVLLLFGRFY